MSQDYQAPPPTRTYPARVQYAYLGRALPLPFSLDDYRASLFGPTPSPPTAEKPPEQQWAVRTKAPHWAANALPAGSDAWTDYRDHGRLLSRRKEHDQAQRVGVAEPMEQGDRVTVTEIEPGVFEARRA